MSRANLKKYDYNRDLKYKLTENNLKDVRPNCLIIG